MSAIDPRRSLALLKPELELLTERIARLTPEELDRPSNLANWSVADVAGYITRVCDSINLRVGSASRCTVASEWTTPFTVTGLADADRRFAAIFGPRG
jgi:hypothetical protein